MKKTVDEIRNIAEKYQEKYDIVGIRTQDNPFKLGTTKDFSPIWKDGEETDEIADGVIATKIDSELVAAHTDDAFRLCGMSYFGDYVAIVAGYEYSYSEDEDGEVIIHDPVVVEILT